MKWKLGVYLWMRFYQKLVNNPCKESKVNGFVGEGEP